MKKFCYFLCAIFVFLTNAHKAFSVEPVVQGPKVLVLIIASDNLDAYLELQKVWKSYMHSDPEHFEVYFIRGNPELPTPYEIKGDDLIVKTEEGYVPGITNKTILSMEAMLPRLKEFDYVLRTNLSSFYVFPRLLKFLSILPKKECYCGVHQCLPEGWVPKFGYIDFVSGAGILLSSDLAELLVREKESIFVFNNDLPDDCLLGFFFQNHSIRVLPAARIDIPSFEQWLELKDHIPKNAFHFRAKNNYNLRSREEAFAEEIYIDWELLNMFYP